MTAEHPSGAETNSDLAERRSDQGVWNQAMAELALGDISLAVALSDKESSEITTYHIPGKALIFPRTGHVRDTHDGGRADEDRGGMKPPQTQRAIETFEAHLPEIQELHDDRIKSGLLEQIASGELTHQEAQARWVTYKSRHNR